MNCGQHSPVPAWCVTERFKHSIGPWQKRYHPGLSIFGDRSGHVDAIFSDMLPPQYARLFDSQAGQGQQSNDQTSFGAWQPITLCQQRCPLLLCWWSEISKAQFAVAERGGVWSDAAKDGDDQVPPAGAEVLNFPGEIEKLFGSDALDGLVAVDPVPLYGSNDLLVEFFSARFFAETVYDRPLRQLFTDAHSHLGKSNFSAEHPCESVEIWEGKVKLPKPLIPVQFWAGVPVPVASTGALLYPGA